MRISLIKRIGIVLLSVFLLLGLTACGKKEENLGLYHCISVKAEGFSLNVEKLYPKGLSIELGTGGKGIVTEGKNSGEIRWIREGEKITLLSGSEKSEGTVANGVMTLDLFDRGIFLVLATDRAAAHLAPEEEEGPTVDLDWWNGSWFGRWTISNVKGSFAETWYDCCAEITPDEDGEHAVMTIWDEDGSREKPMGIVELMFTGRRKAISARGSFWFTQIGSSEWLIDPAKSDYEDMIVIQGHHDAEGEVFDYEIRLRPWGMSWDDVARDDSFALPFRYEWYLNQLKADKPMPDSLPSVD